MALLGPFNPLPRVKTSTYRPQNDLPEAAIVARGVAFSFVKPVLCALQKRFSPASWMCIPTNFINLLRKGGHGSSPLSGRTCRQKSSTERLV